MSRCKENERFEETYRVIEEKVAQIETRFNDAMNASEPAKKLLLLMEIRKTIDGFGADKKKEVENGTTTKTLEVVGVSTALGAVTSFWGGIIATFVTGDPVFLFGIPASVFPVFIAKPFIDSWDKRQKKLLEKLSPLTERLENVSNDVDLGIKLTKKHEFMEVIESPMYNQLIENFPSLKEDFGDVARVKHQEKFEEKYFNKKNKKSPLELDKPKSNGVNLPKKKGGPKNV